MYKKNIMLLHLKALTLQNFKCFKKEQTIDFEKLTILTGANSSGKSSILHAILGAIQSDEMPFKFSPNGKYVNMGDFTEISNEHKPDNIIKIKLKFYAHGDKSFYDVSTTWKKNPSTYLAEFNSLSVKGDFLSLNIKSSNGFVLDFAYDPKKDPEVQEGKEMEFIDRSMAAFELARKESKKGLEAEDLDKFKKLLNTFYQKASITNLKISDIDEIAEIGRNAENLRLRFAIDVILPGIFTEFDDTFNLISSFRLHPSRTYLETTRDKSKVDKFGEGYLDQIMKWERADKNKFEELEAIMKDLELITSLKSFRIGGGRYEVQIKTSPDGTKTALPDVGFGISQFLPIIVADLQLPPESTLMVAEPEIHLHPNVQAKFGKYLVDQIENKNKNYIIETHSEYLLNRIRLAIVNNTLKEENLAVYYLENSGQDVKVHKLKFTKQGSIKNAPKSFFDTYMMDLKEIAFNAQI